MSSKISYTFYNAQNNEIASLESRTRRVIARVDHNLALQGLFEMASAVLDNKVDSQQAENITSIGVGGKRMDLTDLQFHIEHGYYTIAPHPRQWDENGNFTEAIDIIKKVFPQLKNE